MGNFMFALFDFILFISFLIKSNVINILYNYPYLNYRLFYITDKRQKKLHDAIKKKLENEIRKIKKTIKHNKEQIKELNNFIERISNIFKAENISLAQGRLSRLTNNQDFIPDSVATSAKRIQRNFTELT